MNEFDLTRSHLCPEVGATVISPLHGECMHCGEPYDLDDRANIYLPVMDLLTEDDDLLAAMRIG